MYVFLENVGIKLVAMLSWWLSTTGSENTKNSRYVFSLATTARFLALCTGCKKQTTSARTPIARSLRQVIASRSKGIYTCSLFLHYKCEVGKLKLDVNLRSCTRCELPPLFDSFFDSDTELNRSKGGSQYDELEDSTLWTGTNRT